MKDLEIIDAYNELLNNIYNVNELICLSDNSYQYNGENVLAINALAVSTASKVGLLTHLEDICEKLKSNHFQTNPNSSQNELITATADLKYRLGTLYLYEPHIVNLSNSFNYHRGQKHYHYYQTRNDARFNRELPIAFECLYKFWQRISDYLTIFFPELLIEKNGLTYFHDLFRYISNHHNHLEISENYKWLKEFSIKTYPKFNKRRKLFVHHSGYDNQFFREFLEANRDNANAMENLDLERKGWTPFLKEQLILCNEGYFKMMHFLNELDIQKQENDKFTYSIKQPAIRSL